MLGTAIAWAFGVSIGYYVCWVHFRKRASKEKTEYNPIVRLDFDTEPSVPLEEVRRLFVVNQIVHYAKLYSIFTDSKEKALELVEKRLALDSDRVDFKDNGKTTAYEVPMPTVNPVEELQRSAN